MIAIFNGVSFYVDRLFDFIVEIMNGVYVILDVKIQVVVVEEY